MPAPELTLKSLREQVLALLGGYTVNVELSEKELDICVARALRVYNQNRPRVGYARLNLVPGVKKYKIQHPGIQGVTHVSFVDPRNTTPGSIDVFDPLAVLPGYSVAGLAAGSGLFDTELVLGHIETARRVFSSDPEWKGVQERDGYYLYVDVRQPELLCGYRYTWHMTPDNHVDTGLQHMDAGDTDWFIDYVLARAKQILARIRGKFGGIANPEGGTDATDASDLAAEANADLERLNEVIRKRRRPLPPILA